MSPKDYIGIWGNLSLVQFEADSLHKIAYISSIHVQILSMEKKLRRKTTQIS